MLLNVTYKMAKNVRNKKYFSHNKGSLMLPFQCWEGLDNIIYFYPLFANSVSHYLLAIFLISKYWKGFSLLYSLWTQVAFTLPIFFFLNQLYIHRRNSINIWSVESWKYRINLEVFLAWNIKNACIQTISIIWIKDAPVNLKWYLKMNTIREIRTLPTRNV